LENQAQKFDRSNPPGQSAHDGVSNWLGDKNILDVDRFDMTSLRPRHVYHLKLFRVARAHWLSHRHRGV
jgi:hypothetical protein